MTILVAIGAALCLQALNICADVAVAYPGGENTPRNAWTLTTEAESLVREMREIAKTYKPKNDHIAIFSRAQLKYGAQRTDFLHCWYERPMHQNSEWDATADPTKILHPEAWKRTAEIVRDAKMDGLGVCLSQSRRTEVIDMSVMPGGEMKILVELPDGMNARGIEANLKTAELALKMPNAFRIDGKVVLTRYPPITEDRLDSVDEVRARMAERFGPDKFIVIFYISTFEGHLTNGPLSRQDLEWAREHLRRCLRKMDGIFMDGWEVYWPRRYSPEFERNVLIPLYQSVLAEPEFAGKKYLGMPLYAGHENCYRWTGSIDSQGTRTFVERMKTMGELRPDFLICCEWDEQNENTSFRPTISNGYVHQRLFRYFANDFAGRAQDLFPGDDVSVPNLVLSYHKSLIAGEPVEVEVLNIPDGTFRGETFDIEFSWRALQGRTVKSYPQRKLAADTLESVWFLSPASELAAENRLLIPCLSVRTSSGKTFDFGGGLWPTDFNVTRAMDSKWIKQALREVATGVRGTFAVRDGEEKGLKEVVGEFSADAPLKSIEILEGPDTVFMYDPHAKRQDDLVTLSFSFKAGRTAPQKYALNGRISFQDAPGLTILPLRKGTRRIEAQADGWQFDQKSYDVWAYSMFATLPKSSIASAEIVVDLEPTFKTRLKVRDIVEKDVVGVSGPAGGSLVVSRFLSQLSIPNPIDIRQGRFSFLMKPVSAKGVLRMQVVTADERVWRSQPFTFYQPSGKKRTFHVFERDEERVHEMTADANLLDEPTYDFVQRCGDVIWTSAGRELFGTLAGDVSLVLGFGRGSDACNGGDPIERHIDPNTPGLERTTPRWVVEPDGRRALEFKDCAYAVLPKQLVSKYAGYEIAFDVKPDALAGRQALVDTGNAGYGIYLNGDVPEAYVWNTVSYAQQKGAHIIVRGPGPVKAGVWNSIRLSFDQSRLVLSVNGVDGTPVAASCSQMQPRHTSLGAANRHPDFFHGRISNLTFKMK